MLRPSSFLFALIAAHGAASHAQNVTSPPTPVPALAYPGDRIGVPLLSEPCRTGVDPSFAPRLTWVSRLLNDPLDPTDDTYRWQLEYRVRSNSSSFCGTPPPPHYRVLADVGVLPEGHHVFRIGALLGNQPYANYDTASVWVRRHPRPGDDISGTWYAPQQSGRGVFVLRSGSVAALYWATHDALGEPTWVVASNDARGNVLDGEAFLTDGAPFGIAPVTAVTRRWGRLVFDYRGCGRAQLRWDADDPLLPDGELSCAS
jgi:hypothetical protein